MLSVLRFLGVVGAIVLALFLSYGVWLLATPDYDGGRQAVGGMIVAAVGLVLLLFGVVYVLARSRRRTPRTL
jgi:hypothetical protein